MKKNKLFTQILILIALFSCIQSPKSTNNIKEMETLSIPFNSMTLSYLGKTQTNNQAGKIIFEQNRIVMQGESSKEAFDIIGISLENNIFSFQTQNNQSEKASFIFSFSGENIIKVSVNMFNMDGNIKIGANSVTKSKLFAMYKNNISAK